MILRARIYRGSRAALLRIPLWLLVAGIALIGWKSLATGGGDTWIGHLLFVGAGAIWASYTLAVRAWSVELTQGQAYTFALCDATCPGAGAAFDGALELVDPTGAVMANFGRSGCVPRPLKAISTRSPGRTRLTGTG